MIWGGFFLLFYWKLVKTFKWKLIVLASYYLPWNQLRYPFHKTQLLICLLQQWVLHWKWVCWSHNDFKRMATVCHSSSKRNSFQKIISLVYLKPFKKIISASSASVQAYLSFEGLSKSLNIVGKGLKRKVLAKFENPIIIIISRPHNPLVLMR